MIARLREGVDEQRTRARTSPTDEASLANLFRDAAEGKLEDKPIIERINAWLPSNLQSTSDRVLS